MKVPGNFIPWSKSSREREFQGTKVPRYGTFAHVSESSYEWKLLLPIRIAVIFTMRRYALHGLCDHNSVRPSVCPSVTLVHCVRMVQPTIMIFSPYGSPIILVSGDITFIPKFEWGHPERGRWMRVGWVRIGNFRPISWRISETVWDTTKVTIDH